MWLIDNLSNSKTELGAHYFLARCNLMYICHSFLGEPWMGLGCQEKVGIIFITVLLILSEVLNY
jgi:hypothetical protein